MEQTSNRGITVRSASSTMPVHLVNGQIVLVRELPHIGSDVMVKKYLEKLQ